MASRPSFVPRPGSFQVLIGVRDVLGLNDLFPLGAVKVRSEPEIGRSLVEGVGPGFVFVFVEDHLVPVSLPAQEIRHPGIQVHDVNA